MGDITSIPAQHNIIPYSYVRTIIRTIIHMYNITGKIVHQCAIYVYSYGWGVHVGVCMSECACCVHVYVPKCILY